MDIVLGNLCHYLPLNCLKRSLFSYQLANIFVVGGGCIWGGVGGGYVGVGADCRTFS